MRSAWSTRPKRRIRRSRKEAQWCSWRPPPLGSLTARCSMHRSRQGACASPFVSRDRAVRARPSSPANAAPGRPAARSRGRRRRARERSSAECACRVAASTTFMGPRWRPGGRSGTPIGRRRRVVAEPCSAAHAKPRPCATHDVTGATPRRPRMPPRPMSIRPRAHRAGRSASAQKQLSSPPLPVLAQRGRVRNAQRDARGHPKAQVWEGQPTTAWSRSSRH